MITREDLDEMIEQKANGRAIQIQIKQRVSPSLTVYENANHSYIKGAQSIAPMLLKALDGLYFECGNRCAHQNPCNAKEVITEIESMVKGYRE